MRTTITLDEDVAAKLKALTRRTGRAFRDIVNDTLRRGLMARPAARPSEKFRVVTRDLGALRPGLSLDSSADLIEQVEGPVYR